MSLCSPRERLSPGPGGLAREGWHTGTAPTYFSTGGRGSGPAVCHVTQTRCPPRVSKGQAVSKPKETTTASLASLPNHLPNGKEGLTSEV